MVIYDQMQEKLKSNEYLPRILFEKFNIEVLSTTDGATDGLEQHKKIKESGWNGKVVPCFRPDGIVNITAKNWIEEINKLSKVSGVEISSYKNYIQAIKDRREYFKTMGAVSTDHGVLSPYTHKLSENEAEAIFRKALKGTADEDDSILFTANILMEMARMSIEDGLVMQIHPGVMRNHNLEVFNKFGSDKGADIPVTTEFTRNLFELLNEFGNNKKLTLIVFRLMKRLIPES